MVDATVASLNDIDFSPFSLASYTEVQAAEKRLSDLQSHRTRLEREIADGSSEVAALLAEADELDVESLVSEGDSSSESKAMRSRARERELCLEEARREILLLERATDAARKHAEDSAISARASMVDAARRLLEAERAEHAELLLRLHEAERRQLAIEKALSKGIRGPAPPRLRVSMMPRMQFIGPSSTGERGYYLHQDEAAECIRRLSIGGNR